MAGAAGSSGFRRDGDGSPDVAFHRRRARLPRRAARIALRRNMRQRTAAALAAALSAALATLGPAGADAPGARSPHPKGI